jgi:hypothetical protein
MENDEMTQRTILLALAAGLLSTALHAAPPAVVEAVQYPAWLERDGRAVPLAPGTALQSRDQLRTGGNARVQLRMGEGSTVKLGENAKFVIERAEDRNVFAATLRVLTGAFRFTTDALKKSRRRDVTIQVKNVTAGVRGTDLWGKSGEDRDLVCLLEGRISVGSEGHPTVTLDNPLDFYQKPSGGNPEVSKVERRQVELWAQETDIPKDGAAAREDGDWRVIAATFMERDAARALVRDLRASGYPAELGSDDQGFFAQVGGLAGEGSARALMSNLRDVKGVRAPRVTPMPRR